MLSTLRDSIDRKLMLHEWHDNMVFGDLSNLFRLNFSNFVKSKVSLKSAEEITKAKELMIQMDRELFNGSLTYYPKPKIKIRFLSGFEHEKDLFPVQLSDIKYRYDPGKRSIKDISRRLNNENN